LLPKEIKGGTIKEMMTFLIILILLSTIFTGVESILFKKPTFKLHTFAKHSMETLSSRIFVSSSKTLSKRIRKRDIIFTTLNTITFTKVIDGLNDRIEKGKKIRSFPISHLVIPYLTKWLSEEKQLTESPYLFPSKVLINKPLSTNTFRVRFKEICKKANIVGGNAHIHAIRHTVAFMMCEMGNNIDHVSKFLGHSSSKITREFYVKDSCEENLNKLEVPWFQKNKDIKPIVPECLKSESKKEQNYEDKSKYKKKLAKSIQLLAKIS
jgi:hypothetical protein